MRKLLLLAILAPLMFACNTTEPGTKLIVNADNLDADYLILKTRGFQDTIFVTENGCYEYDFQSVEEAASYYISHNNEIVSLEISPDETVELYFDGNNVEESAMFSGDHADINNYMADKRRNPDVKPANPEVYGMEYVDYKSWADKNLKVQIDLLNNYEKHDESDKFWIIEEANILYKWATQLSMYTIYYERYGKNETVSLPDDYLDYRNQLDFNKPEYLESASFTTYLVSILKGDTRKAMPELKGADETLACIKMAARMIENKKVRDYISVTLISNQLSYSDLSDMEPSIAYFKENCIDPEQLTRMDEVYDSWYKISKGQAGFDFVAEDLEGNEVKFSDFTGKYVYVDVWATWCAPCKREIPHLKKLEADYHDRNIVFVSYSIDSDKQAWLDFVPENELGGVQIIGDNAWNSTLPEYYKVGGVPTFLFFGPDGNIISVKMTRPSNPETRVAFDSYDDL